MSFRAVHLSARPTSYGTAKIRYRIAWSDRPDVWAPHTDARCPEFRYLKGCGQAAVRYVRTEAEAQTLNAAVCR